MEGFPSLSVFLDIDFLKSLVRLFCRMSLNLDLSGFFPLTRLILNIFGQIYMDDIKNHFRHSAC